MALNVLIVDDSAAMRRVLRRVLTMIGLPLGEVFQAGNGREALACLDEHWVDLALVDIHMPVMNGLEFLEAARRRADAAELLTIVISSDGSRERRAELRALNAEFIHKPYDPESVRRKILTMTGVDDG